MICSLVISNLFSAKRSPILPGTKTNLSRLDAMATSICVTMEFLYASLDIDLAIPVVPSTEIPPIIPNLGFIVFLAIASPSGMEMVTLATLSGGTIFSKFFLIILRGTGLIA